MNLPSHDYRIALKMCLIVLIFQRIQTDAQLLYYKQKNTPKTRNMLSFSTANYLPEFKHCMIKIHDMEMSI